MSEPITAGNDVVVEEDVGYDFNTLISVSEKELLFAISTPMFDSVRTLRLRMDRQTALALAEELEEVATDYMAEEAADEPAPR